VKPDKFIEVINVTKEFNDGTKALDNCSLTFDNQKVTVIIGPSGSGKSTLLRMLNLLELPTSGDIMFEGNSILKDKVDLRVHRESTGMVFQNFNLFPHLTVLDNINLAQISVKQKKKKKLQKYHLIFCRKWDC
jgi:polar amino acid transport system ATP-binding protein